jgi:hypothetical protein
MLTILSQPLVSYLIGALLIMAGGILFVGAFVLPRNLSLLFFHQCTSKQGLSRPYTTQSKGISGFSMNVEAGFGQASGVPLAVVCK